MKVYGILHKMCNFDAEKTPVDLEVIMHRWGKRYCFIRWFVLEVLARELFAFQKKPGQKVKLSPFPRRKQDPIMR